MSTNEYEENTLDYESGESQTSSDGEVETVLERWKRTKSKTWGRRSTWSDEIRTETRISNINLKKTEKTRLALKFSQEIRTETHISNFNLKGDLVRNIYVWGGGGDMFRIIYLRGVGVFRIIHRKT